MGRPLLMWVTAVALTVVVGWILIDTISKVQSLSVIAISTADPPRAEVRRAEWNLAYLIGLMVGGVGSLATAQVVLLWWRLTRPRRSPGVGSVTMADDLASVRGGYDRWAAVYDHDGNPLQGLEGPIVRAIAGDVRGLNVLDLGCGTGRHSLWLAEAGAAVTGVDFSEGMLAEARKKPGAEAIRFVVHDLHQPLPFAAEFDLVVSGLVLEHLRELDPFFAEAHRVLKPGGRAVVSAMHPAMCLRGTAARFTDPASGEVVQPGSLAHSVSAFVMAAVRAGFRLDDLAEFAVDGELAARYPRAAKYLDWPMLVVMALGK